MGCPRNRAQKLGIAIALQGLLALKSASAEAPLSAAAEVTAAPLTVSFKGPDACDPNALESQVRKLLKAVTEHAGVHVTARASRLAPVRYVLDLQLTGAVTGKRSLSAARCDEALRAGAVVVALAINPQALTQVESAKNPVPNEERSNTSAIPTSRAAPGDTSAPNSAAAPAVMQAPPLTAKPVPPKPVAATRAESDVPKKTQKRSAPPAANPNPTPERALGWVALLSARLATGSTPKLSAGIAGDIGMKYGVFRASLSAYWTPGVELNRAGVKNIRVSEYGGGVSLCAEVLDVARFSTELCARGGVTRMAVSASSLVNSTQQQATVLSVEAGPAFSLELAAPLSLRLNLGVSIPTTQPSFVVDVPAAENRTLFAVKPGGFGLAGLELKL